MTFSTSTEVHFYLNRYKNTDDVRNAILAVESEGGITNTHLALKVFHLDF